MKNGVYFTMHQCAVSRSVTCTPRKPFSGQCDLSFRTISLNLDGLQVCRIAGKQGKVDEQVHDFSQTPHLLCAVCNWGVVIRLLFHSTNSLGFAEPPLPPGN